MSIDVMKQARDAMQGKLNDPSDFQKAITALDAAIAAAEKVEPVRLQCTTCGTFYEEGMPPCTAPPADVVRDAERYRWLRENWTSIVSHMDSPFEIRFEVTPSKWGNFGREVIDAAIDEARKK